MKHTPLTARRIARRFLRRADSVLEIGAADGAHTRVYAKRVGRDGHVRAVEPNAEYVQALQALFARVPWVTVEHAALGAMSDPRPFYTNRSNPKRSSVCRANAGAVHQTYMVPGTTLDACVRSMPREPRLIQIDAQGAESEILLGATKTLQLPCVWVVELWATGLRQAGGSVADVLDLFAGHDFTPRTLLGERLSWHAAAAGAAYREGSGHIDYVMVPEDLMEADW